MPGFVQSGAARTVVRCMPDRLPVGILTTGCVACRQGSCSAGLVSGDSIVIALEKKRHADCFLTKAMT